LSGVRFARSISYKTLYKN